MKVIKIEGIRGIFTAAFCVICAFAGFVAFPGQVIASLWNLYLEKTYMFPHINNFQGVLLWFMLVIVYCIITAKKGFALSFQDSPFPPEGQFREMPMLSDKDIENIIKNAKMTPKAFKESQMFPSPFNPFEEIQNQQNGDISDDEKNDTENNKIAK